MNKWKAAEILGIAPNATKKEVKDAFRRLTKSCHPDVGGDSKQYAKILEAYEFMLENAAKEELSTDIRLSCDDVICLCLGKTLKYEITTNDEKETITVFVDIDDLSPEIKTIETNNHVLYVSIVKPKNVNIRRTNNGCEITVTRKLSKEEIAEGYIKPCSGVKLPIPKDIPYGAPIEVETPTPNKLYLVLLPDIKIIPEVAS